MPRVVFPRLRDRLEIKARVKQDIYRQVHAQAATLRTVPPSFRTKVPNKALIVAGGIRPIELIQELTAMRVPITQTAARKSRA